MTGGAHALLGTLLAAAAFAAAAAPAVPLASDLRRDSLDAARSATPLVLFFTLPDCSYCHTVRHHYLAALVRGEGGRRYIVREISIEGASSVKGLDGKMSTHRAQAQYFGARFGPTVLFVDAAGRALAPPLVGGDTAGMYGAYLDGRLASAHAQLTNPVK